MKKTLLSLFFLVTCCSNLFSQTLLDLYPKYLGFGFGYKIYDEDIERINGREDHILNYDQKIFDLYKDSISNPEAIIRVQIELEEDLDLQKAFDDLALFPNLFYLKIEGFRFFKGTVQKEFPKDLKGIKNVEFLNFSGDFGVDKEVLDLLATLPNLRFLAFNGFSKEKTAEFDFQNFQQLEGLHFAAHEGPNLHASIGKLASLKSIVLSADLYPDFADQFIKLQKLPQLKNVLLRSFELPKKADTVLKSFSGIRRLELKGVQIEDMGQFLTNLSRNDSLVFLKIFGTGSKILEGGFENLKQLKYLELSRVGDSLSLPADIYSLENLNFLKVSEMNNLTAIRPEISNFKKLDSLILRYNDIEFLPKEMGELKNLKYLDISNNELSALPPTIGDLKYLKELLAGSNQLSALPPEFGALNSLEVLEAGQNEIVELPAEIGKLENLRMLNLTQNLLSSLPNSIGNLRNLKELHLGGNDLQALPPGIEGMRALKVLDLKMNFLKELPSSFGNLQSLEVLWLENNNLLHLPESFGNLKNLKKIYLQNRENSEIKKYNPDTRKLVKNGMRKSRKENFLEELPQSFAKLEKLEILWLSGNPLKEEPLFEILKNLEAREYTLQLENCWIDGLPSEGWDSILVEYLFLDDNQITSLPENMKEAPHLSILSLRDNPLGDFSRNFDSREEILIAFKEAGFIEADELPKTTSMAKAFLDLASYGRNSNGEKLDFFNQAFRIDSAFTVEHINNDRYAEVLLKEKQYEKAIEFFTRAIQEDTLGPMRILNFIVPEFRNRAKAYLAVGDTLAAIKDLETVSSRFNAGDWGEAALLARNIQRDSLEKHYFEKAREFYKERIDWDKKKERTDYWNHLSLLEVFIISEDIQAAQKYLGTLEVKNFSDPGQRVIFHYLKTVLEIMVKSKGPEEMGVLKEDMLSKEVESWNFDLFRQWSEYSALDTEKVQQIKTLTNLLEWNQN